MYYVAESNIISASSAIVVTGTTRNIYLYNVTLGANFKMGDNVVLNEDLPPDTVKPKDLHGSTLEVSRDVYDKIQKEIRHDYRGLTITNKEANE